MWDGEVLRRSVIFVFVLFGVIMFLILLVKEIIEKARKANAAPVEEPANEELGSPCKIIIKVNKHFTPLVGDPWSYGLSLNGAPPVLVEIGSEIELTTNVKRNKLLGYDRTTFGSYNKPNKEEPFTFYAESGGTVRLVSDARFENINNHLHWKSNFSVDKS